MKRIVIDKLLEWKNSSNRKPLILRGARQIGKTYSIIEFGKKYFKGTVHVIDLEKHVELHKIFQKNFDVKRILSDLELFLTKKIDIKKDILFFDEIQNCKHALAALRYFYEDLKDMHIIAAGSLIEFALKDISFPVGRVQIMEMYPMNFYEFLLAKEKEMLAEIVLSSPNTISEIAHDMLIDELREYFFVGGMPEAVKEYVKTNKIISAFKVQKDLLATFRQDFSKYAGSADKRCLDDVLISISQNVGNQIKYTKLSEGFSIPTIKNAFQLLLDARVIAKIRATSLVGLPLGASVNNRKFKSLFLDIGLMQQACGLEIDTKIVVDDLLAIYKGALAEQFVGQELLASELSEIYYWSRDAKNSNAEIDFLFSRNGKIFPIEVKSGSSGRLKSLHLLLKTYPKLKNSYVFSANKFSELKEQKITFLPLYYAYKLGVNIS
ncbi:MAG: AAA family ATPase [Melioribacteraceae bacterium]|nr:AAA family ATPase [Melioribacteraceae bacterium]